MCINVLGGKKRRERKRGNQEVNILKGIGKKEGREGRKIKRKRED